MRLHLLAPLAPSLFLAVVAAAQSEVPLVRYRDAQWPSGPPIPTSAGASFFDYDRDGWPDFYNHLNGALWHNDAGVTWTRAANLEDLVPNLGGRYGSSCGDYDNDGLPDIATEPRQSGGDDCFHLFHNLGNAAFVDVAVDPAVVIGQPCEMNSETSCWADVDDDGDLDLWVTAYPEPTLPDGGGNRFWENLGPIGPGGAYQLELSTEEANLGLLPNVSRPEGAQMLDVDRDGDVDAYANGILYQNVSVGTPSFRKLVRRSAGILSAGILDEGALFSDYDLDGDPDLMVLYQGLGNRLWENRGDGMFFEAEGVIDRFTQGATQGSSSEDWDMDGDLDLTTGHILRRNMLVETGERFLRIAEHELGDDIQFASPAWADWDKDGDVDVLLSNWHNNSFLYRNTTYDERTAPLQRRSIRVHVVRDDPFESRGLETEFGATVEVRVHGDASGFVRRRFVASAHGYLQQSEYDLTIALPSGPDPEAPADGVRFDLLVDFPGRADRGILRIDGTVNPALHAISLAKLTDRQITVFRSGKVVLDGVERFPRDVYAQRLLTTAGGLALPAPGQPLADPLPAPFSDWYVGLDLDTFAARAPLLADELVIDGALDAPAACKSDEFHAALWDVTTPGAPQRVWEAELDVNARNRRHFAPVSFQLLPRRHYRLVARVTELRPSPIAAPVQDGPVVTRGGLSFQAVDSCDGALVEQAVVDSAAVQLALRFRTPTAPPGAPPRASPGTRR